MKTLSSSSITNPMMAAMTTGLVRAAVSEALARLPEYAVVCSVTTDGFLSSIPVEAVDKTGPVAKAFIEARLRITPDNATIWEEKHRIGRALVTKTRGRFPAHVNLPYARRHDYIKTVLSQCQVLSIFGMVATL